MEAATGPIRLKADYELPALTLVPAIGVESAATDPDLLPRAADGGQGSLWAGLAEVSWLPHMQAEEVAEVLPLTYERPVVERIELRFRTEDLPAKRPFVPVDPNQP